MAELRRRKWRGAIVEQTIPKTFIKRDMFGFVDVVALDHRPGFLLLQVTSYSHVANRARKIREQCNEAARECLEAGNRIQVWGWHQPGGARSRWKLRTVPIELESLSQGEPANDAR